MVTCEEMLYDALEATEDSWFCRTCQTLDWIVSRDARAVAALVPEYVLDGVSPSDHLPVLAVYET